MSGHIDVPIGRKAQGGRSFSVAYRLAFLKEWDNCIERGAQTRLLRENGLAAGTVRRWLQAREQGEFTSSMVTAATKSRNQVNNEARAELARLRTENQRLQREVTQSQAALDIMGKAFELLKGINESSNEPDTEIPTALMSAEEYSNWLERNKLS